jgi:hypothetical protein
MKKSTSILILPWLMITAVALAQTDNSVSRSISKTITLAPDDVFSISGEKATINLKGWDKNYIELKIIFTAEHTDRKIAAKEIEYMYYSLSRDKKNVELRNAFLLPSDADRIHSRVKIVMELRAPSKNTFSIYNKYGDADIRDLSGKLSIELEFGDLILDNISGQINIKSSYSEIRGEALGPSSFISNDEESKYILSLDKGTYAFNSRHGDHHLTLGSIQSLKVNATHTDVTIQAIDHMAYNYQLLSREGKIFVPRQFTHSVKKESGQSKFVLTQAPANPLIDIKTTFNSITIQY